MDLTIRRPYRNCPPIVLGGCGIRRSAGLPQATSWHPLAFCSFNTRHTLARPIRRGRTISEGLAPPCFSLLPCGRRTTLKTPLSLGLGDALSWRYPGLGCWESIAPEG